MLRALSHRIAAVAGASSGAVRAPTCLARVAMLVAALASGVPATEPHGPEQLALIPAGADPSRIVESILPIIDSRDSIERSIWTWRSRPSDDLFCWPLTDGHGSFRALKNQA